jgi:hypothetical protein
MSFGNFVWVAWLWRKVCVTCNENFPVTGNFHHGFARIPLFAGIFRRAGSAPPRARSRLAAFLDPINISTIKLPIVYALPVGRSRKEGPDLSKKARPYTHLLDESAKPFARKNALTGL